MPSIHSNSAPGMASAVSCPPLRHHQRVVGAVDDQRRHVHRAQLGGAVAICHDRHHLAGLALRVPRSPDAGGDQLADQLLVEGEAAPGHEAGASHPRLDAALQGARIRSHERRCHLGVAGDEPWGGEDGGQGEGPLRVVDHQALGDHAAHGGPHYVGGSMAQGVEEPDGVLRHVRERVGGRDGPAGHGRGERLDRVGRPQVVQVGGQADVAVVEPDHPVAPVGQLGAEVGRPCRHLGAQAHYQEHRRVGRVAELLVLDGDSVRPCPTHAASLCHPIRPSPRLPP